MQLSTRKELAGKEISVPHVGVGEVQAGQQDCPPEAASGGTHLEGMTSGRHVQEDHVGRRDEALVLPALQQQLTVPLRSQLPRVRGGQGASGGSTGDRDSQAAQQLGWWTLDDDHGASCGADGRVRGLLDGRRPVRARAGWQGGRLGRRGLGGRGRTSARQRLLQVLIVEVRDVVLVSCCWAAPS